MVKLEEVQVRARSLTGRVAHAVTRAAGTAPFPIAHVAWFAAWIEVNSGLILRIRPIKQIAECIGIDVLRGDGSLAQETDLEHDAAKKDTHFTHSQRRRRHEQKAT